MPNIQIVVERPAGENGMPPAWRDAIYMQMDEWNALSPDEQAQYDNSTHPAVQERYDDWLARVTAPAPEPEPAAPQSQDDVASQAAEIAVAAAALAQQAADLAAANQPAPTPAEEVVQ